MNIPIYSAVKNYMHSEPVPFHMPGHKLGKGFPAEFLEHLERLDVTEIPGTDNLHFPEGAVREAQELAAEAFGADETFFLVNGSTCGLQSMILTLCGRGDKLIVTRDCHSSVIGGMMLAGARPVYVKPGFEGEFGIPGAVTSEDIGRAICENPDAAGVIITRPNYYGICSDIDEIARIVHAYGKVLAVDEAHGAHLRFHPGLPVSAMEAGADICVQSAHKTLPAFTQGAYLHVKNGRVDVDRLKFHLRLLQTTSPSYIIMSFLDIARAIMAEQGEELLERLLQQIARVKNKIYSLPGLKILTGSGLKAAQSDATRLVINVGGLGKKGFEVEKMLREAYNIQVEMSDLCNIVCITTTADRPRDFEKLCKALEALTKSCNGSLPLTDICIRDLRIPEQKIDLQDIMHCKGRKLHIRKAAGEISLRMLTPYPPGIPVICPGERITSEAVDFLCQTLASGGKVNGLEDSMEMMVAL